MYIYIYISYRTLSEATTFYVQGALQIMKPGGRFTDPCGPSRSSRHRLVSDSRVLRASRSVRLRRQSASGLSGAAGRRTRVRVRPVRRVIRPRRERRARRVKGGGWPAPGTRGPVSRGICLCGVVGAARFGKRISLPSKLTPQRPGAAEVPTLVLDFLWLSTRRK